jgi:hypothetical protein
MCWNQYVSINTFVFGIFVMLLIAFNNKYSKYKMTEFNNVYVYFFLISFVSMQLIEFFLWRNLNNTNLNKLFSLLGSIVLLIQPLASLSMLHDKSLKWTMSLLYFIPACLYLIYDYSKRQHTTSISKSGHLKWYWLDVSGYKILFYFVWLFFFFFSMVKNKYYTGLAFGIITFLITYYSYFKDGSAGSLWCWTANFFFLFYAFKLLIYLPYIEYGSLC